MSYQVLARKFRPGTFAGLIGQDHVVRALTHALDHDRLHHAYLFTGTRGVGKTTIARVLAKCLNCEQGVSSTPCGECSICQEVNENRFVDLIEVDAASRTRVDDTRELLENAQYLPTRGRYKVYLIDEVHMLSASSFNALLKTLEEPPEHVKFLLATTDPKKVPVTVLSRCLQFQLKNISPEKTADYLAGILEQEGIPFEPAALAVIGRAARGSMRDALSITDQAIGFGQGALSADTVIDMLGLVGRDEVGSLVSALAAGDAAGVLAVVAELADRAVDFENLLAELLGALHAMAVSHAVGSGQEGEAPPPFDAQTVQLLYQIGLMGYRDLGIAPDPKSGLEMTLLRMLSFAPDDASREVPPLSGERKAPSQTRSPAARATDAPAVKAQRAQGPPSETPIPANARGSAPARTAGNADRWQETVEALSLGGVARMLAEHSIARKLEPDRVELILDRAHDTLLGDAQAQAIERALAEHFGQAVNLLIEPGEVDVETPADRRARLARERQQAAESLLEADETVRTLLDEFGGRLDEVQPVESPAAARSGGRQGGRQ
ncbi:MAG TPA: DNA polymerase III subunit gamma/tau [Pseudomonadales bacterium]